ncbi:MAG TPA: MraY family glycosyltransferase [Verrucomicrobiae bacterium]|jgi:UDP-GlcNAc:undecaprenyl-phosphate GlcNAc-1-phosphate transferase|nr:MraY family glycosyltransferase [Verrucomicrobiae bacterium]
MVFPGNVYLAAFAAAATASAASVPGWRRWCRNHGLVDDPGHRKIHTEPTPLAGGLAAFTGLVMPLLAGALLALAHPGARDFLTRVAGHFIDTGEFGLFQYGLSKRGWQLSGIVLGALGMLGIGLRDDQVEMRPAAKFSAQLACALLVAAFGVRLTLFVHNIFFSYALTALWILTVINAFNFMDNMNGLCAGLGAIAAAAFGAIAAQRGQYLVGSTAWLIAGALAGFLPFNYPRASAFLGDAGSHLTGYLLAILAILPHFYTSRHPNRFSVLTPLLVLAVPLGDMVWVVCLRWRKGQPFYVGDTNHLSHRLVRRGLTKTKAVALIWALALAAGGLAFLLE